MGYNKAINKAVVKYIMSQKFLNKKQLILISMFALILLFINVKTSSYCVSGFPLEFSVKCSDVGSFNMNIIIFNFVVDFLFWFIIAFISFNILRLLSKLSVLKYFLIPLFLTILSIIYYQSCDSFFCIFEGHGFPIGYYENWFSPLLFFVDYIYILIIYFILTKLLNFIKKRYEKNDPPLNKSEFY